VDRLPPIYPTNTYGMTGCIPTYHYGIPPLMVEGVFEARRGALEGVAEGRYGDSLAWSRPATPLATTNNKCIGIALHNCTAFMRAWPWFQ
jgi:hypothetical protein